MELRRRAEAAEASIMEIQAQVSSAPPGLARLQEVPSAATAGAAWNDDGGGGLSSRARWSASQQTRSASEPWRRELEAFSQYWGLDGRAKEFLCRQPPGVVQTVLAQFDPKPQRDRRYSAKLVSFIRSMGGSARTSDASPNVSSDEESSRRGSTCTGSHLDERPWPLDMKGEVQRLIASELVTVRSEMTAIAAAIRRLATPRRQRPSGEQSPERTEAMTFDISRGDASEVDKLEAMTLDTEALYTSANWSATAQESVSGKRAVIRFVPCD